MSTSLVGPDARFDAIEPFLSPVPDPDATVRALVRTGNLMMLSGQVAFAGDQLLAVGRLGDDVDVDTGHRCARQCALNLLGRVREELGTLDRIARVVKVTVFVASAPGFREQHVVANGASDVIREVLGEAGRHARAALGVAELPLGSPVEVEAIVEVA